MIRLTWYRTAVAFISVLVFFSNFSDYSQRWGIIPLFWIIFFGAIMAPLAVAPLLNGQFELPPLVFWGAGFLLITIFWFYPSKQDGSAFQDVQTRMLSVIVLYMMTFILSRPAEQHTARIAVAVSVLLAVSLNVYELFNPLTFSTIPGRSSGLYANVNQSGAALMLGMIVAYGVIPQRFKTLFLMLTAVGIITTFSRAAIVGWILVVLYFAFRSGLSVAHLRRAFLLCIAVFGFLVSPYWGRLQQSLEERGTLTLDVLQRLNFFSGDTSDASSVEREHLVEYGWRLFSQAPLLGHGTGAHLHLEGFEVGVHNIYLAMMIDHGIIGAFFVPLLLLAAVYGVRKQQIDLVAPFVLFLSFWGFFSHNVLEERFILVSVAIVGAIVAGERALAKAPEPAVEPDLVPIGAVA
jgi:hypothetical protein